MPYLFFDRAPSRLSRADGGGWVTLIGSDAGKLSFRPSSSEFSSRRRVISSSRSFSVSPRFFFASKNSFSISVSFGIPMIRLLARLPSVAPSASMPTIQRFGASRVPRSRQAPLPIAMVRPTPRSVNRHSDHDVHWRPAAVRRPQSPEDVLRLCRGRVLRHPLRAGHHARARARRALILIGRAYVYGLGASGERGVARDPIPSQGARGDHGALRRQQRARDRPPYDRLRRNRLRLLDSPVYSGMFRSYNFTNGGAAEFRFGKSVAAITRQAAANFYFLSPLRLGRDCRTHLRASRRPLQNRIGVPGHQQDAPGQELLRSHQRRAIRLRRRSGGDRLAMARDRSAGPFAYPA